MPNREEHNKIAKELRGKLFDKSMPDEKIDAINKWMDNPATQTGEYRVGRTGELINPSNHRDLRHTPTHVARALSGDGTAKKDIVRVAQIHVKADKGITSPRSIARELKHISRDSGSWCIIVLIPIITFFALSYLNITGFQ